MTRWRFDWLFAAPHRLAFCAGALLLAGSSLWWASAMLAHAQALPLRWGMPPAQAHGLVMALGFMPLFFCGFLFTAGPRWLGHPPVPARALAPALLAQLAGWAVFLLGAHGPDAAFGKVFGALGLAAVATGWSQVWWRFQGMLRTSRSPDRSHARLIAAAGGVGVLCLWTAAASMAAGEGGLVRTVTLVALWSFIGTTYVTVTHRMIPFFSAAALPVLDAWRPHWLLWSLVGLLVFEGIVVATDSLFGPQPAALRLLQAIAELCGGFGLLGLAVRWGLVQSLANRLLAMLHLGFVWLGLALVLSGASHAMQAASGDALSLGVAPLHAYTMGFLGSILLSMVTRVTCGHGGRTLTADNYIWRLFWVLQLAVVVRVAAAMLPGAGIAGATPLIALAATAWGAVCIGWALRYGHWYGTPRVDGRPG
jgi:uncharacterized protein involved in response to NO